jgi:hypothetical protein
VCVCVAVVCEHVRVHMCVYQVVHVCLCRCGCISVFFSVSVDGISLYVGVFVRLSPHLCLPPSSLTIWNLSQRVGSLSPSLSFSLLLSPSLSFSLLLSPSLSCARALSLQILITLSSAASTDTMLPGAQGTHPGRTTALDLLRCVRRPPLTRSLSFQLAALGPGAVCGALSASGSLGVHLCGGHFHRVNILVSIPLAR